MLSSIMERPILVQNLNVSVTSGMTEKAWKAWKSAGIWAKSLQNRLKIDKSAEIWTSQKPEFRQLPETYIPVTWTQWSVFLKEE